VVVVEGATLGLFVTELFTMLIIGLVLSVFGIGFLRARTKALSYCKSSSREKTRMLLPLTS
jgi:hypothetical protein